MLATQWCYVAHTSPLTYIVPLLSPKHHTICTTLPVMVVLIVTLETTLSVALTCVAQIVIV